MYRWTNQRALAKTWRTVTTAYNATRNVGEANVLAGVLHFVGMNTSPIPVCSPLGSEIFYLMTIYNQNDCKLTYVSILAEEN